MKQELKKLSLALGSVAVFRGVLEDPVISGMRMLIAAAEGSETSSIIGQYGRFVGTLYEQTVNFSEYVLKTVLEDENIFIVRTARGGDIDEYILEAAANELLVLQELSRLSPETFTDGLDYSGFLPQWRVCSIDFLAEYKRRRANISQFGYGKWAQSSMFTLRDGRIVPLRYPDPQRLSELYGYERERRAVVDNTLALLDGKPAQNALLYGDAGTGKSSTVKAIVNEYSDRGLRLIEITKEQLRDIPRIIGEISENPLKFILFIDDLSFAAGEDCFGALKAVLEGSASARSSNMVIYATSNRRHLVRESFSEREGDDIHRNDTMQETLSLSARFGLRVSFGRPDKKSYTAIARELARSRGIELPDSELDLKAEQFALSSGNGRSPRTAKQFVDTLINNS